MSGRSAYVRKVKVDKNNKAGYDYLNKDDTLKGKEHTPSVKSDPSISEFPRVENGVPSNFADHPDFIRSDEGSSRSIHSGHYEAEYNPGYARIRRPEMPVIETSGIEKSAFRSKMEKSSENFRHNFANVFKKKKGKEELHETPPATPIGEDKHELPAEEMQYANQQPTSAPGQTPRYANQPPQKRLGTSRGEALPLPAKMKLWRRKGQPIALWDKVDVRDPDLWDPKGDVLVFYAKEAGDTEISQPAFRLGSHMIESIGSPIVDALLRDGLTDDMDAMSIADSYRHGSQRPRHPTPPGSESSKSFDASQISYRFTLPTAGNISGQELLRYKLSWRNVFAVCSGKGIVGYTLHQAITDLHERFQDIMPRHQSLTYIPVNYTEAMGWHDLRDDPESACSMLIWSEHKKIHWQQGWHEAFVHCAGMYNDVALLPSWKNVSPATKLMLEKASVETSTQVAYCEELLAGFDYGSYWPEASNHHSISSRDAFVRLQEFFRDHYSDMFGTWPPMPPASKNVDGWLTRLVVRTLAADFYALYDYLVDRQVIWNSLMEINSRRSNIVRPGSPEFRPDSHDCEFTSLIERFDSHHNFPSIPHPYPRLPQSCPPTQGITTQLEARKSALAYTEATNIFLLGDEYEGNDMVEAYMQWEKTDRIGECDPRSARRARWVLVYFILQTLSTLVVDKPGLVHTDGVEYFLSGKVEQQPVWIEDQSLRQQAEYDRSHCWTISSTWQKQVHVENNGPHSVPERLEPNATGRSMSSISSYESMARTTTFSEADTANDLDTARTSTAASIADSESSFVTMQPAEHLSIRTRDLSSKSTQSPSLKTVSLFPAPPRQPIEPHYSSKSSDKYYSTTNQPPSQPPKSPLPQTPSSYGSTPRNPQNPNRNVSTYQSTRARPSPYQASSYPVPPPGHEGEIMGLRIHKSASSTPISSPTLSSPHPNTLSQRSNSGYGPGIEKLEEPIWPSIRKYNNGSPVDENYKAHQKRRNAHLHAQQVVHIHDFDEQM
ncbi:446b8142-b250-4bed-a35d-e1cb731f9cfd-CDS [Sclerotinia trifoliorum]|uniref:446b8142-b250-4bed-a35d-e1cb731f9cfd-CDS n=1 Tax=Sclerotinia trifoliorum TaxID=28548 RepID=A0A8H2ZNU3_9HELO|nr:446b8142-b250-4bed-a35d-e1cb731f9cfd-CDS [Sclerotinia trifoliorum]